MMMVMVVCRFSFFSSVVEAALLCCCHRINQSNPKMLFSVSLLFLCGQSLLIVRSRLLFRRPLPLTTLPPSSLPLCSVVPSASRSLDGGAVTHSTRGARPAARARVPRVRLRVGVCRRADSPRFASSLARSLVAAGCYTCCSLDLASSLTRARRHASRSAPPVAHLRSQHSEALRCLEAVSGADDSFARRFCRWYELESRYARDLVAARFLPLSIAAAAARKHHHGILSLSLCVSGTLIWGARFYCGLLTHAAEWRRRRHTDMACLVSHVINHEQPDTWRVSPHQVPFEYCCVLRNFNEWYLRWLVRTGEGERESERLCLWLWACLAYTFFYRPGARKHTFPPAAPDDGRLAHHDAAITARFASCRTERHRLPLSNLWR